jgi:hypothetical protein
MADLVAKVVETAADMTVAVAEDTATDITTAATAVTTEQDIPKCRPIRPRRPTSQNQQ